MRLQGWACCCETSWLQGAGHLGDRLPLEVAVIRLLVRIVGTDSTSGRESILAQVESATYSPDHLEAEIGVALDQAVRSIGDVDEGLLRQWQPEVSIALTADDEQVRPSLHLSATLLERLVQAGVSFDFDPYV